VASRTFSRSKELSRHPGHSKEAHDGRRSESQSDKMQGQNQSALERVVIPVVIGQGNISNLKAAKSNQRRSRSEQVCTGIFVTRLMPNYSARQIQKHIDKSLGLNVVVEKMQTRFDTYSSFHVRCDKRERDWIMDPNLWSVGVLVKPFYQFV
jgi:hypothetical protein